MMGHGAVIDASYDDATMTTVDLIYFNAGGGHRAAAQALDAAIREQGLPWRVRLVNLVDVLDPNGRFRQVTGFAPEDLYNKRLARGWTLGLAQELKLLQGMIRMGHAAMLKPLMQHWARTEPDLVVSLIPNFNRVLFESVARALPGVPYVTVLTDLADHPPHFWIEPGQAQYFVCGSARAVEQALAAGHMGDRIYRSSGMILRPDFYRGSEVDREAERARLGVAPGEPLGIVMFGGQGSAQMKRIAALLRERPLILMCGHNRELASELRALQHGAPRIVVEFTPDVQRWMRLADYFIGKPGPGCLSEAVQMGLPVLTTRNAWTMPQERYNTEWVRELGVGVVHRSMRELPAAVASLVARLPELRVQVARVRNRAVFELPGILAQILQRGVPGADPASTSGRSEALETVR